MSPRFLVLAVVASLAGCSAEPTNGPVGPSTSERLTAPGGPTFVPDARDPRLRSDTFYVDTNASADGTLTAVEWTVPGGALIDFLPPMNGAENSAFKVLIIEAAFLLPPGKDGILTNDGIAIFRHDASGMLHALFPVLHPTVNSQAFQPEPGDVTRTPPSPDAFRFRIGPNAVREGENLTFVALLQGTEPTPVRFAFRVHYQLPEALRFPVEDFRATFPHDATRLTPTGTGTGFQLGTFDLVIGDWVLNGLVAPPASTGRLSWSDAFQFQESFPIETPLIVADRFLRLTARAPGTGGTVMSDGLYAASSAAGRWNVNVDCYGMSRSASSLVAEAQPYSLIPQDQTVGTPWYVFSHTGAGACELNFSLDVAGFNGHERVHSFFLQMGADTVALTGKPLDGGFWAHLGRVGGLPAQPRASSP